MGTRTSGARSLGRVRASQHIRRTQRVRRGGTLRDREPGRRWPWLPWLGTSRCARSRSDEAERDAREPRDAPRHRLVEKPQGSANGDRARRRAARSACWTRSSSTQIVTDESGAGEGVVHGRARCSTPTSQDSIGDQFALGEDELEVLRDGRSGGGGQRPRQATRIGFERPYGKLLEAYTPIRTPDGTQVLFEIYQRFDSVSASAEDLLQSDGAAAARRGLARAPPVSASARVVDGPRARAWTRRARASARAARSRPRRRSGGGSRPTSTTAWCRTWPVSRSGWRR